jgi:CubicO group peptidase (beta-lactamase class C family)
MIFGMMNPRSLTGRAFPRQLTTLTTDFTNPAFRCVEVASASGIGQARAIARAYGALATGGAELGIKPRTMGALMAPAIPPTCGERDLVMGKDLQHSLGFGKPCANTRFSTNGRAFGWPGLGGSLGFADPDAQIGFGYVMNRIGYSMTADPRALPLADAVYRCLDM